MALAGSNKTAKTEHTLLLSYYESPQMVFIKVKPCSTSLMLPPPSFAHSLRPFFIHRFSTILSACFLGEKRTKVDGLRLLVAHEEQHREGELSKTRKKGSRFDVINLRMAVRLAMTVIVRSSRCVDTEVAYGFHSSFFMGDFCVYANAGRLTIVLRVALVKRQFLLPSR